MSKKRNKRRNKQRNKVLRYLLEHKVSQEDISKMSFVECLHKASDIKKVLKSNRKPFKPPENSPEYKAMRTRGLTMAGRLTIDQYWYLISKGYDGEKVMRWTMLHAHKEIDKINTRDKTSLQDDIPQS